MVDADNSTTTRPPHGTETEVVAFLRGRSVPCPRCAYDLRDNTSATCPECGEPLVLKIGSPRARFGWLVLAMAPGCFSGVAATFVMVPILIAIGRPVPTSQAMPWPIMAADAFGFMSAASVAVMYHHRHRIMAWIPRRQAFFAAGIWATHVLAFALFVVAMVTLA